MGNLEADLHLDRKYRILVVDDEESNCIVFVRALQLLGYEAESAVNGRLALERLKKAKFDVMLLDLKMPEMDGETVLTNIRTLYPELGVIVLTAHATLESAIGAVKAGAVDYLLKPQRIADIDATIQRALKRREASHQKERLVKVMEQALSALKEENISIDRVEPAAPKIMQRGCLVLDIEQRIVTILSGENDPFDPQPRKVELTEVQIVILVYLANHAQKVVSSSEIAARALGYNGLSEFEAERIVRPHILRLRRKLESDPQHPQLIRSIRGKGYCFSA